jgi:signal transduction histidine kinase
MTLFEDLKLYVGFTEASSAALRELHPFARPFFVPIVDDFYAAIKERPGARGAITGGDAQIQRLKSTLCAWLDTLLLGPHDEAYYAMRARIGSMHVRIDLPQQYMFAAMNRIRVRLQDVIWSHVPDRDAARRMARALEQILDLELAIMLETYREDMEARSRETERLATIGQFAASIGHELRNPLGVVESSAFLLRQHLGEQARAPQIAKHLDRIAVEIARATQTITQVLDLARNRPPKRTRTKLAAVVDAAAKASLLPAAVSLESSVPAGLTASIDADQLTQVLTNLIVNASQALGGRGHVWIDGEPSGAGARLRVRDDGPGVRDEDRARVFEALFTTKPRGNGLGLALCRRIMEGHGGTIQLEESSTGASFLLTFPE